VVRVCANERRVCCVDDPLLARLLACREAIVHIIYSAVPCRWKRVSTSSSTIHPLSRLSSKNRYHRSARSIDCSNPIHHPPLQNQSNKTKKQSSSRSMAGSKFVEILDISATPYSQANVDLQATIDESRRRSASSGSISSSNESVQSPTSPTSPTMSAQPIKMRLRALSIRRPKKT
jgi:hypothetical protein